MTIENELKEEIKKAILNICNAHNISDSSVNYKLELIITLNIDDKIVKPDISEF